MDFDDILNNPAFYILCGVGIFAFVIMLMVLKGMGQADIMPVWVKIATLIFIPVAAAVFAGIFSE